jgi:hypothetical protein
MWLGQEEFPDYERGLFTALLWRPRSKGISSWKLLEVSKVARPEIGAGTTGEALVALHQLRKLSAFQN